MVKIIPFALLLIHSVSFAQLLYKPVILCNGYENGELVRNHVEMHYTHYTSNVVSGYIVVSHILEFAHNNEMAVYSWYIQKDTIDSFYGTIIKGKKQGTFLSVSPEKKFRIQTYVDGEEEGPFKGYYAFGQLYNTGYIKNGRQTGEYKQYYANGKPSGFVTNNMINHVSVEEYFYQNGQRESTGTRYRGRKVNEWVYYDYNGNLKKKEYYNNKGKLLKTMD
jgi:hypothetical protein